MLGPAASVVTCILAVKLVATGKEFVVAGVFGRSDALDAFLAAILLDSALARTCERFNQSRSSEGMPHTSYGIGVESGSVSRIQALPRTL